MAKVVITNSTKSSFFLTSRFLTDNELAQDFHDMKASQCSPTDPEVVLEVPKLERSSSEAFFSLFITFEDSQDLSKYKFAKRSLLFRLKIEHEHPSSYCSHSYMLTAIPNGGLFPASSWCSNKTPRNYFWIGGPRHFAVTVSKRAISKFFLELSESPERFPLDSITCFDPLNDYVDEVFENEHKNHWLGHAKYSKEALGLFDRPAWTDSLGFRRPHPEGLFAPSPLWRWKSEWTPSCQLEPCDQDGWSYSSSWKGPWKSEKSFGKLVRRRRWIRVRTRDLDSLSSAQSVPSTRGAEPKKRLFVVKLDSFVLGDAISTQEHLSNSVLFVLDHLTFMSFKLLLLQRTMHQLSDQLDGDVLSLRGLPPRLYRQILK